MTPHRLLAAAGLALLLAGSAQAFDPAAMSAAEREAFRAEVRAYLLENPEVLAEAIDVLQNRRAEAEAEGDQQLVKSNSEDLFADAQSYTGGNLQGSLTVVEFIDYRCSYCRKAHSEVAELVQSDGDIRYVIKELPILGEESVLASRFAIAVLQVAGPEAYARAHTGFYEDFRGPINARSLGNFAEDLGLDRDAVMARMDAPEVTRVIEDNHLLAQRMRIQGTPTFVMGDQMLRGYVPLDGMRAIVSDLRS